MKSYDASLRQVGLSRAWGDACLDAGHALQCHYQKQGIESARLDPNCGGYCFWTIIDGLVKQGELFTSQGLYNAFWEPKPGGAGPEQFRKFNGPTVLLARLDGAAPIAVSGETVACSFWISHFGEAALNGARLTWNLRTGQTVLAAGSLADLDVALGEVRRLGDVKATVPELSYPRHASLEARLEGSDVTNQWDLWLFPKRAARNGKRLAASTALYEKLAARYPGIARAGTPEADRADILVTDSRGPDATAALAAGRRVVVLQQGKPEPNVQLGWWWLGDQTGTAMLRHPALGDFPHDGHISPLWFRIIKRAMPLRPGSEYLGAEPLMIGEGKDGYCVYMLQARAGRGRLLYTCGLDLLADVPEAVYLLDTMLDYARSDGFAPRSP
jgi:hypothetical protein